MARPFRKTATHLHAAIEAVCPIRSVHVDRDGPPLVASFVPTPAATPAQIAAAQLVLETFDSSEAAEDARENLRLRSRAVNIVNGKDAHHRLVRATAAVLIDELNLIRQWLVSFKAQVALASNLADLKTRVATLPNMPDRTLAQAKTAIENKLNSGTVDT